jgi:flagellar biosynthesis anti-sigma factor FlgM
MVDNISNVSQSRTSQADSAQRSGGTKQPQTTSEKAPVDGARQTVDVELSSAVRQAEEKALFDAEKVNAIKAAIENGSYPLDSRKIAENFLELERLI